MAELKTLTLDKVLVPARLRDVEEDHAFMIGQSITRVGLLNPITVRATPRAERPWTLVAGAHRLRGSELAGLKEIDAIVVKADKLDGELVEIEENVFRNELSALDRAIFVRRYRELWEEKHGKIERGNPQLSNSVNLTELGEDSAQGHFFQRVAERLGLSRSAVERAQFIGQKLTPELRRTLRGTPIADNQSRLIKLAGMEPERQKKIAVAFAEQPDLDRALDLTDPHAKAKASQSAQDELLARLKSTWARTDEKTRAAFLQFVAAAKKPRDKLPTLTELLEATADDAGGGAS